MAVTIRYLDAEHTRIMHDGMTVPAVAGNSDYDALVASGVEIAPYEPPVRPLTADDVRAEAQRRIIAIVGASDLNGCIIKQLNASMRAVELVRVRADRDWTPQEAAEAEALEGLAAEIKRIRAVSNTMETNPPADYADGARWINL